MLNIDSSLLLLFYPAKNTVSGFICNIAEATELDSVRLQMKTQQIRDFLLGFSFNLYSRLDTSSVSRFPAFIQ